jgi:hypothetical protein
MGKLLTAQEVADRRALKVPTIRRMILERRIATAEDSQARDLTNEWGKR